MQLDGTCDLLVIGSGVGGLASAVSAARHGHDVLLIEKNACLGGTTAVSGGGFWIPNNFLARQAGVEDSFDKARDYIRAQANSPVHSDLIDAYLRAGDEAMRYFHENTALKFVYSHSPDHHTETPGGMREGRGAFAAPFDLRELGPLQERIAPSYPEQRLWGMTIPLIEMRYFLSAGRSLASAKVVATRLGRHLLQLLRHGRSTKLVNGGAVIGRLVRAALDAGVHIHTEVRAVSLTIESGAVTGAVVEHEGARRTIAARRGVVLACGGFAHDLARHPTLLSHVRDGAHHVSLSPRANTGDGLRLGESAGGQVETNAVAAVYWMPVSFVPRRDGSKGLFPHSGSDRGKPGYIAVTRAGRRFVSEACNYHQFVLAMLQHAEPPKEPCAFILCDHRAIRRYGLGYAKPFPFSLRPHLRSGYLASDATLEGLASKLGIDAHGLRDTVHSFNTAAAEAQDPAFNKGANAYERAVGDPAHLPHPNLRPLGPGPFYGVRVVPADVGTFAGLKVDASARVLGRDGAPVTGLYAVGADMANIFAGHSPGGGTTLGPALTFGYLIGRDLGQSVSRADVVEPVQRKRSDETSGKASTFS